MAWYFVEKGERHGPVDEEVFDEYVASGRILAGTRVWREGLSGWQEFGKLAAAGDEAGEGGFAGRVQERCTLCERPRELDELIRFEEHRVCPDCRPAFVQRLKEGSLPEAGTQYGGFWIRFVAYMIDTMVIIIPMAIVGMLFSILLLPLIVNEEPAALILFYILLLGLQHGVPAVYEIVMIKWYGATLGKMVFNLKVVDGNGEIPGWGRSTGRHFAKYLNQLLCNAPFLIIAFDPQKRGLQDHICNTRVIRS